MKAGQAGSENCTGKKLFSLKAPVRLAFRLWLEGTTSKCPTKQTLINGGVA
jgi:hypothetical protein